MVYEYKCGGCSKYGGLGDCLAVNGCIKDKPEPEEPREDGLDEEDWIARREEEFRANWGDGR